MKSTFQGQPLLVRVVPLMLLGFGALHIADWAYVGFTDPWKLVNGIGMLLLGGANLAANRLELTHTPGRGRSALLGVGVSGFVLAGAAMVHRWL